MFDEVFEIFREEAREHLRSLEKAFLDLETTGEIETRRGLIDGAFRHAHSLKSDAKVVGLPDLKVAAQQLEDILDELREHPEAIPAEAINTVLAQFDQVRSAYECWQSADGGTPAPPPVNGSPPSAPEITIPEPVPRLPAPAEVPAQPVPTAAEETFTVRVPSERLDRLLSLAGEVRISQRAAESVSGQLVELSGQLAGILRTAQFCERTVREQSARDGTPGGVLNGDLEAVRRQLEVALDQTRRIGSELKKKRGREALLVESLETNIRRARLLPLVMLTDSLRRVVRDLSQSLGKPIQYVVDIGSIMLDKAVIEALKDPLMHMLRNAADHGIETAAERLAAGKPETGVIRIEACRRGPLVRITLTDDGRGVDFSRVRERIARSGLLDEAEIAQLSERELGKFLYRPGFSTAAASDVSGRGVGLDVVLDTVRRLQGNVELESSSPAGSTFAITVPVTVSTVRILTVLSGGQYYGFPSSTVVRTGRASRSDLRELEGCLILPVNGEPVRWMHLADLVGGQFSRALSERQTWSYLLISGEGRKLAVAVEELEDESEVLLKPLGYPLAGLQGVMGATVRADGQVQLVLDLSSRVSGRNTVTNSRPAVPKKVAGRILVVDDSPTTRAVLRNVFTAAGFVVTTATDGLDALDRLRAQEVDVVISDVEMPRLNGFDLARQIKSRFRLPVILVTGREREEHRREGLEAGADAYVVKSTFEDKGLLEIVEQFI